MCVGSAPHLNASYMPYVSNLNTPCQVSGCMELRQSHSIRSPSRARDGRGWARTVLRALADNVSGPIRRTQVLTGTAECGTIRQRSSVVDHAIPKPLGQPKHGSVAAIQRGTVTRRGRYHPDCFGRWRSLPCRRLAHGGTTRTKGGYAGIRAASAWPHESGPLFAESGSLTIRGEHA